MKAKKRRSYRKRLNAAFLAVSLVPLLLCSALLLQIFRLRTAAAAQQTAEDHLLAASAALDTLRTALDDAADALRRDAIVRLALTGASDTAAVYDHIFDTTESVRAIARVDLYDAAGRWRYSTRSAPLAASLPTDWGVLHAAAGAGPDGLVLCAAEENAGGDAPLLYAAAMLADSAGDAAGYLVVSLSESQLRALLGASVGAQNELLVLDGYWRAVFCTQPSQTETLAAALRAQLLSGDRLAGLGDDFNYTVRRHAGTGLSLVLQQPQVFTHATERMLYSIGALCGLVCIALSILLSLQLSRQIFRPVGRLHDAIGRVGADHDLSVRVPVPEGETDELAELAERFNAMVDSLHRNQQALLENQRALNEAQIRMLQAQLNPHFLCNTLDTMKWISKINQVPQVAVMSTNLADILRFCISPAEFVPLRRELDILERYVEIQRIRLSDSFSYGSDIPSELLDETVPKMLLQPLAENAILHGLSGVPDGRLFVSARREGDDLVIRVQDNGPGFPPELLGPYQPPAEQTGHLGLLNVDTILRKHYGEGFGLCLENAPEGGACITARLPAAGKKENGQC